MMCLFCERYFVDGSISPETQKTRSHVDSGDFHYENIGIGRTVMPYLSNHRRAAVHRTVAVSFSIHSLFGEKTKDTRMSVLCFWRRRRDLNPRYPFGVYTISNRARSASYATSPCASALADLHIIHHDPLFVKHYFSFFEKNENTCRPGKNRSGLQFNGQTDFCTAARRIHSAAEVPDDFPAPQYSRPALPGSHPPPGWY